MSFMDPLLALQDVDTQIFELEQELKDIPRRKAEEVKKLRSEQNSLFSAQNDLRKSESNAADFAFQAKAVSERDALLQKQQGDLSNSRQIEAVNAQIAANKAEKDDLETKQIHAMEAIPEAQRRVEAAQARVDEASSALTSYFEALDQRLEEAKARLAELQAERAELAKNVRPQYLRIYDRLRIKRRPTVVPLTDNDCCGGCHLAQPPSIRHLIKRDNALVTCEMCGRILY